MFSISYAVNELRRRWSRTVVTALGLAAGVGLVMGIVGVSQGLSEAQTKVLSPLGSVGTDILVTRTVGATAATSSAPSATPSPSASASPRTGDQRAPRWPERWPGAAVAAVFGRGEVAAARALQALSSAQRRRPGRAAG